MDVSYLKAEGADVSQSAKIGEGSKIWHLAQIREEAVIGRNCTVGRGAYIGSGVTIGDNSKIQNYALIYEPAVIESGVFVGPAAILTNDTYPRAVLPDGSQKDTSDWDPVGVVLREGSSIGAGAICVAPVTIGRWSMIAAGAVVTSDVPDFAMMVGTPARRIGWVGRTGKRLVKQGNVYQCPDSGKRYEEIREVLHELEGN